jgi:hypothetical protein
MAGVEHICDDILWRASDELNPARRCESWLAAAKHGYVD